MQTQHTELNGNIRGLLVAGASISLLALGAGGCTLTDFKEPMKLGGKTISAETLNRGKESYTLYCRACHGENGDGHGISATGLRPPPRDFTQGLFKFGGVPAPALPPDEELKRIVMGGLHGTAMHPWDVPEEQLEEILQYIKTFSPRWKDDEVGKPVEMSADPFGPSKKAEAIELGKRLYHAKAQCSASCHPNYVTHQELFDITKAMNGSELTSFAADMYVAKFKESEYCLEWKPAKKIEDRECATYKDAKGEEHPRVARVVPPDFTRDALRNVRIEKFAPPDMPWRKKTTDETTVTDLYRTLATGIGGAGMPPWKGALKEEEIWGLVYYVKSLIDLTPTEAAALHSKLAAPANLAWTPPAKAPEPVPGAEPAPTAAPAGAAPAPAAAPSKG